MMLYYFHRFVMLFFLISMTCADKKIKQKVLAIEDCKLSEDKYDSDNAIEHNFELIHDKKDKIMIKANFTITKKTLPVYYSLRIYKVSNTSKKLDVSIENISCKHPVMDAILKKIKVKYNDDCSGNPGQYLVPKLNMDDLIKIYSHMITSNANYNFEVEFVTRKGVIVCLSVTTAITKN